jgi:hypothetical protein
LAIGGTLTRADITQLIDDALDACTPNVPPSSASSESSGRRGARRERCSNELHRVLNA